MYADEIVVITEEEESFERTIKHLIDAARNIGLMVNENKTKCVNIPRKKHSQNSITIIDLSFGRIWNIKYLGVGKSLQADNHEEIHKRNTA